MVETFPNAVTCLKPTEGGLHFGHYIGNIQPLLTNQVKKKCYFMFVDLQSMNMHNCIDRDEKNLLFMMRQIIDLGVNPKFVTFAKESDIKSSMLKEAIFLSNYITNSRIERLPIFKATPSPYKISMLMYPVLQAMDFLTTRSSIAFSNTDNKPAIELINELFNRISKSTSLDLPHIELIHGIVDFLVGIDGKKMSKAHNNCVFLDDDENTISKKVNRMYTDPKRIHSDTPGNIDQNIVFKWLLALCSEEEYNYLEKDYILGKISDSMTKKILCEKINSITCITYKGCPDYTDTQLRRLLENGTEELKHNQLVLPT